MSAASCMQITSLICIIKAPVEGIEYNGGANDNLEILGVLNATFFLVLTSIGGAISPPAPQAPAALIYESYT